MPMVGLTHGHTGSLKLCCYLVHVACRVAMLGEPIVQSLLVVVDEVYYYLADTEPNRRMVTCRPLSMLFFFVSVSTCPSVDLLALLLTGLCPRSRRSGNPFHFEFSVFYYIWSNPRWLSELRADHHPLLCVYIMYGTSLSRCWSSTEWHSLLQCA
jgi:hypothetical protein